MSVAFLDLSAMHTEVQAELDEAWRQVSRSGKLIGGEFVERFEAEWAAYCGTRHCVGVANGTAALQLILEGLGIGRDDEVILPASTFFATAEAVIAAGALPRFVDVDPDTLLMTAEGLRAAISPRTAAVIVVHLYGQPADMEAIGRVAAAAGIAVIEDAAQAHGASWQGRRAGGLSYAGAFSFYPGKNLGAFGDAGAVTTGDGALAERIRSISNHGRAQNAHYRHERRGGNHRLDGLQAAVLSVKLKRLDAWNAGRRRAAAWYETALEGLPLEPVRIAPGAISSHHLAVVRSSRRDHLRGRLNDCGIGASVHYPIACHRQPAFAATEMPSLPVAEGAAEEVLSLPMHPHLTPADVRRVADAIAAALALPAPGERLTS
jgi:dTDP-4-amino-4,6-dideoxygalactose transaminase